MAVGPWQPRDTIREMRAPTFDDPEYASPRISTIPPPPMPDGSVCACCPSCGTVFAHDGRPDDGDDTLLMFDAPELDDVED